MTTTPATAKPGWYRSIVAAKRAAAAALTDDEKAAQAEAQRERRERVHARRAATLARLRRIVALYDSGRTVREIAKEVGRTPSVIIKFAAARGVTISRSESIHRAVLISREREDALRRLADDYGATPAEALDELLKLGLADDATVARRICGVKRRRAEPSAPVENFNKSVRNQDRKPPTRKPSAPMPPALSAAARLVEPHAPRAIRVTIDERALAAAAQAFAKGEIDKAELLRRISR